MKAGYMAAIVTCSTTTKERALQTGERPYMVRSQVIDAQVLEFTLFFAVTSVANCMTVHNSA